MDREKDAPNLPIFGSEGAFYIPNQRAANSRRELAIPFVESRRLCRRLSIRAGEVWADFSRHPFCPKPAVKSSMQAKFHIKGAESMKKCIVSWLMTLVMVLGLVPTQVWADMTYDTTEDTTPQVSAFSLDEGVAPLAATAGTVTEISTADDLVALGGKTLTGNYKLTADIDMSGKTMKAIAKFSSGTFDGNGHTIKNLSVAANNHVGLFAQTGDNAIITGITLENVGVSNGGGYNPGVGGLVGKAGGTTTIENCGVSGTVSSSFTSAVYLGGLVGYGSSAVTIKSSYSAATVTGSNHSSSRTGGLIGNLASGGQIENCYTRGTITGQGSYAAGFAGYANGGSSAYVTIDHCYVAANVNATSGYYFAYNPSYYCTITNCYYDSTLADGKKAYNKTSTGLTGKTTEELKTIDLGDAFVASSDGYPILKWQVPIDPNASYEVKFAIQPRVPRCCGIMPIPIK